MKKTSQEIMNGIEKIERLLMGLSDDDCQVDGLCINLGRLKAQRQERLECYKKELIELNNLVELFGVDNWVEDGSEYLNGGAMVLQKRIYQLKQEIKTLEEK